MMKPKKILQIRSLKNKLFKLGFIKSVYVEFPKLTRYSFVILISLSSKVFGLSYN